MAVVSRRDVREEAGETRYLWRAVDHEGGGLEAYATKSRDKAAALKFLRKAMKRYGKLEVVVTDEYPSYRAAMKRSETKAGRIGGATQTIAPKILTRRSADGSWRCRASGEYEVCRSSLHPFVSTQSF